MEFCVKKGKFWQSFKGIEGFKGCKLKFNYLEHIINLYYI